VFLTVTLFVSLEDPVAVLEKLKLVGARVIEG
jgi:hypothetical protein